MTHAVVVLPVPHSNKASVEALVRRSQFELVQFDEVIDEGADCADVIVIPGVSSFSESASFVSRPDVARLIASVLDNGGKVVGICSGMQVLFDASEEAEGVYGLSFVSGKFRRFDLAMRSPIIHMGWKKHEIQTKSNHNAIPTGPFYFCHSYFMYVDNEGFEADWYSTVFHGEVQILAAFSLGQIVGFQFHPEKSSVNGLKVFEAAIYENTR